MPSVVREMIQHSSTTNVVVAISETAAASPHEKHRGSNSSPGDRRTPELLASAGQRLGRRNPSGPGKLLAMPQRAVLVGFESYFLGKHDVALSQAT